MTLQFRLGPRNTYGQAQLFIAPALSRTFQNAGQISVSEEEWMELQSRLTQPKTSETEENGPDTPAPVARYRYDDLVVELTDDRGVTVVHLESLAVDSSSGETLIVPLEVRVTADEIGMPLPDVKWEGEL